MTRTCPISLKSIDTQIVRINSVQMFFILTAFLFTNESVFINFLLFDFTMRLFKLHKYSPLTILSVQIIKSIKLKSKFSDEAPKKFALILGWIFLLTTSLAVALDSQFFTLTFTLILLICTALEAAFEFCIGCTIYQWGVKLFS